MSNPFEPPQASPAPPPEEAICVARPIDSVIQEVAEFFAGRKYRLESGTPEDGVYGTGSDLLRLLLGGFVKRNKFSVTIRPQGSSTVVTLDKAMSGAMGGAMGMARMNNEWNRIRLALSEHLNGTGA